MNRKQAIKECKLLWAEIEQSGMSKMGFFDSLNGQTWEAKGYVSDCPLCNYIKRNPFRAVSLPDCDKCPLVSQQSSLCTDLGYRFTAYAHPEWFDSIRKLKVK